MTDSLSSIIYIEEIVHDMVLRSSVFTDRFFVQARNLPAKRMTELFTKKFKFILAYFGIFLYNNICCDMRALKREVAATVLAGFPWSECQVRKLATSHCTI